MNDLLGEYANIFMAAPIATILLVFIFFTNRLITTFVTGIIKIQTEIIKEQLS